MGEKKGGKNNALFRFIEVYLGKKSSQKNAVFSKIQNFVIANKITACNCIFLTILSIAENSMVIKNVSITPSFISRYIHLNYFNYLNYCTIRVVLVYYTFYISYSFKTILKKTLLVQIPL